MEPVNGAADVGNDSVAEQEQQLEQFEATITKALFSFGQSFIMDDLQELGNED